MKQDGAGWVELCPGAARDKVSHVCGRGGSGTIFSQNNIVSYLVDNCTDLIRRSVTPSEIVDHSQHLQRLLLVFRNPKGCEKSPIPQQQHPALTRARYSKDQDISQHSLVGSEA